MLPKSLTTVTQFSKVLAMILFVTLPVAAFYLGLQYRTLLDAQKPLLEISSTDVNPIFPGQGDGDTWEVNGEILYVKKILENETGFFTYELWKDDKKSREQKIYTATDVGGMSFEPSHDGMYIAIINLGHSMGDESFTLIRTDGTIVKDLGHMATHQALIPFHWTDHYYWLVEGVPIDQPFGVFRVNADTLHVDRFILDSNN